MKKPKGYFIYFLIIVLSIASTLTIDWLIATSNLPDWFKFALLSK